MFSYGPPHMAEQKQDDQLEPTFNCSVRIRDIALRPCQKRWTIGRSGERGSGISVLVARQDDHEEIYIYYKYKSLILSLIIRLISDLWISLSFSFEMYLYHHHHHHIVLAARISLTLSRHFSLSFIALGRSSGQQPVSSHSCWMYVRAGRPAFARPCVGIHKSTSLMSSSLLLQQCPACLVRLTWIVFVIGGRWPYSWCLVGCCCQDLFRIARSILV